MAAAMLILTGRGAEQVSLSLADVVRLDSRQLGRLLQPYITATFDGTVDAEVADGVPSIRWLLMFYEAFVA